MTDQIPADKVRAILANRDLRAAEMIAEIESILPPRPTLADMPWVERAAYRWMQCDVKKSRKRHVIVNACDCHGKVELVSEEGEFRWEYPNRVTPRPDLPRLEWPGDKKPEPAPATLTEGSEWGDIDALTDACRVSGRDQITVIDCDGDVSVWNGIAGWWQTGTPSDGYEPYTIIHTGKKADQ